MKTSCLESAKGNFFDHLSMYDNHLNHKIYINEVPNIPTLDIRSIIGTLELVNPFMLNPEVIEI